MTAATSRSGYDIDTLTEARRVVIAERLTEEERRQIVDGLRDIGHEIEHVDVIIVEDDNAVVRVLDLGEPAEALNFLELLDAYARDPMGGDLNQVTILTPDGAEGWDRLPKAEIGRRLAERIAEALEGDDGRGPAAS